MAYNINFAQTNREDFGFFFSATSTLDDTEIDFTGGEVTFVIADLDGCVRLSTTLAAGDYVTLPLATTLKYLVPAAQMAGFCPGTYRVFSEYTLDNQTEQLITGTLSLDGIDH